MYDYYLIGAGLLCIYYTFQFSCNKKNKINKRHITFKCGYYPH